MKLETWSSGTDVGIRVVSGKSEASQYIQKRFKGAEGHRVQLSPPGDGSQRGFPRQLSHQRFYLTRVNKPQILTMLENPLVFVYDVTSFVFFVNQIDSSACKQV